MKKLFILCMVIVSGTAVFAQHGGRDRNYNYPGGYSTADKNYGRVYSDNQQYGRNHRDADYSYRDMPANSRRHDNDRWDSRRGNQDFSRDCETNRGRFPQRGRSQASVNLGKGLVIGAAAGLVLGAILSH